MTSSKQQPDESITQRLIRIETRIVKIMEALGLDPYTGKQVPNRRDERHQPESDNERK